jgi:hypothetical protein
LMVQKNGHLLAIDHARAFEAQPMSLGGAVSKSGIGVVTGDSAQHQAAYQDLVKSWWPRVSGQVKATFNKKVEGIKHPTHKQRVQEAFNKRVAWLDGGGSNFGEKVGGSNE